MQEYIIRVSFAKALRPLKPFCIHKSNRKRPSNFDMRPQLLLQFGSLVPPRSTLEAKTEAFTGEFDEYDTRKWIANAVKVAEAHWAC